MNRKKIYTGCILGMTLLSLFGCQAKQSNDTVTETNEIVTSIKDSVEVEFWHAMSGDLDATVNELVDTFNTTVGAEKGITVKAVYQGSYEDLKSKTTAAIKAGKVPGLAQALSNYVVEYMQAGVVQPLDEYISNSEVGIQDFEDIYEAYRNENSQYSEDGTFYSLPFNKSTEVLIYNKTFFDENNLSVPTTWDEMEQVSKQIKELTGNAALGFDAPESYLITMIKQFGGEYTSSTGELLFDAEGPALKALELLKRNTDAGYWRLAGEDKYMSGPFTSGLVSMYIGSSASYSFLQNTDFEWATAPIPQISDETKAVIQQGSNIVVFNQNKSAEEVYGAYEFVKFLCSTEGNLQWVLNTGYLPIRESVTNNEAYQQYVEESGDTTKITGPAQADAYFYEPSFFNDSYTATQVRSEMRTAVEKVVLAGEEPKAVLEYTLSLFK